MPKRLLLGVIVALIALASFAPAALAQGYYGGTDDYTAPAPAPAPAPTYAPLPDTGGSALALPAAGLLMLGGGIVGIAAVRRSL